MKLSEAEEILFTKLSPHEAITAPFITDDEGKVNPEFVQYCLFRGYYNEKG